MTGAPVYEGLRLVIHHKQPPARGLRVDGGHAARVPVDIQTFTHEIITGTSLEFTNTNGVIP